MWTQVECLSMLCQKRVHLRASHRARFVRSGPPQGGGEPGHAEGHKEQQAAFRACVSAADADEMAGCRCGHKSCT